MKDTDTTEQSEAATTSGAGTASLHWLGSTIVDLLPCPFCGGNANEYETGPRIGIECSECHCQMGPIYFETPEIDSMADEWELDKTPENWRKLIHSVRDLWNKRSATGEVPHRVSG